MATALTAHAAASELPALQRGQITTASGLFGIRDHAQAVYDFVVWRRLRTFAYLTHDEGSSVGRRVLWAAGEGLGASKIPPDFSYRRGMRC